MNPPADPPHRAALTAILGRELCRPLDRFEAGLARLLREPARPLTDAERNHAQMLLRLCDELRALAGEALGAETEAGAGGDDAGPPA